MTRRRLLAPAVAIALLAGGCAGEDPTARGTVASVPAGEAPAGDEAAPDRALPPTADGEPTTDESADDGPTLRPSAEAIAALDWQTIDTDQVAIDGRDLAGGDVVLWIWAPWCSVCHREAPEIRPVLLERADELTVLGLAGKDSLDAHRGFVDEHDLSFMRHVVDQDNSIWPMYGVNYQPAFVFINQDGRVAVHAGPIGSEGLDDAIDQLIAA